MARRNVVMELARRSPEYLTPFVSLRISVLLSGTVSVRDDELGPWPFSVAHDGTPSAASVSVAAIIASTVGFKLPSDPGHGITCPNPRAISAAFLRRATRDILTRAFFSTACRLIAARVIRVWFMYHPSCIQVSSPERR